MKKNFRSSEHLVRLATTEFERSSTVKRTIAAMTDVERGFMAQEDINALQEIRGWDDDFIRLMREANNESGEFVTHRAGDGEITYPKIGVFADVEEARETWTLVFHTCQGRVRKGQGEPKGCIPKMTINFEEEKVTVDYFSVSTRREEIANPLYYYDKLEVGSDNSE